MVIENFATGGIVMWVFDELENGQEFYCTDQPTKFLRKMSPVISVEPECNGKQMLANATTLDNNELSFVDGYVRCVKVDARVVITKTSTL